MDSSPPSATPTDIELTAVNKLDSATQQQQKVNVQIAFSTHVGWDGVSVIFFSLGIAGLFVYITVLYTKSFQAWHRPWVWLFLVFAALYVLLVVKFLCTWKTMAESFTKLEQICTGGEKDGELIGTKSAIKRAKMAARNAKNVYEKLKVNGPWFLWKLYFLELLESAQQCANLLTIYLCSLPVVCTIPVCFGITIDCIHTGFTTINQNIPARRNRQIKIERYIL
mgnify:CR=1 FL=1